MQFSTQTEHAWASLLMNYSKAINNSILTTGATYSLLWSPVKLSEKFLYGGLFRSWTVKACVAGCTACLFAYAGYKIWQSGRAADVTKEDFALKSTESDHLVDDDITERVVFVPHGILRDKIGQNLDKDSIQQVLSYHFECSNVLKSDVVYYVSEATATAEPEIDVNIDELETHQNILTVTSPTQIFPPTCLFERQPVPQCLTIELKLIQLGRGTPSQRHILVITLCLTRRGESALTANTLALTRPGFENELAVSQKRIVVRLYLTYQRKSSARRQYLEQAGTGLQTQISSQQWKLGLTLPGYGTDLPLYPNGSLCNGQLVTQMMLSLATLVHEKQQIVQKGSPVLSYPGYEFKGHVSQRISSLPCQGYKMEPFRRNPISPPVFNTNVWNEEEVSVRISLKPILSPRTSAQSQLICKVNCQYHEGFGSGQEPFGLIELPSRVFQSERGVFVLSCDGRIDISEASYVVLKDGRIDTWIHTDGISILEALFKLSCDEKQTEKDDNRFPQDYTTSKKLHYDPDFLVPLGVAWADICPAKITDLVEHELYQIPQNRESLAKDNRTLVKSSDVRDLQIYDWVYTGEESILKLIFESPCDKEKTVNNGFTNVDELQYDPEFSVPPGVAWADICPVDVPEIPTIGSDTSEVIMNTATTCKHENFVFNISCCLEPSEYSQSCHSGFEEAICHFIDNDDRNAVTVADVKQGKSREDIVYNSWATHSSTEAISLEAPGYDNEAKTKADDANDIWDDEFAIPVGVDWADLCPQDVDDVPLEEQYQLPQAEVVVEFTVWGLEVILEEEEGEQ